MELFHKDTLKNGDHVVFRNGRHGEYNSGWFYVCDTEISFGIKEYDNYLGNFDNDEWSIMEILRPTFRSLCKRDSIKLTVQQIKNLIGYDFEIVEK